MVGPLYLWFQIDCVYNFETDHPSSLYVVYLAYQTMFPLLIKYIFAMIINVLNYESGARMALLI